MHIPDGFLSPVTKIQVEPTPAAEEAVMPHEQQGEHGEEKTELMLMIPRIMAEVSDPLVSRPRQ